MAEKRNKLYKSGKNVKSAFDDLSEEDSERLHLDIKACKIARKSFFPNVIWENMTKEEKYDHYDILRKFLENFDTLSEKGDENASKAHSVEMALGLKDLDIPQALEGVGYAMSIYEKGYHGAILSKAAKEKIKVPSKKKKADTQVDTTPEPPEDQTGDETPDESGSHDEENADDDDNDSRGGGRRTRRPYGGGYSGGIKGEVVNKNGVELNSSHGMVKCWSTDEERTIGKNGEFKRKGFTGLSPGHHSIEFIPNPGSIFLHEVFSFTIGNQVEYKTLKVKDNIEDVKSRGLGAYWPFNRGDSTRRTEERSSFFSGGKPVFEALVWLIAGIILWTFFQSFMMFLGCAFFAFRSILPDSEEFIKKDIDEHSFKNYLKLVGRVTGEAAKRGGNEGLAGLSALFKVLGMLFLSLGLWSSPLPLSNLIFLIYSLGAYFTLPIRYEMNEKGVNVSQFFESLFRFIFSIFLFGFFSLAFQSLSLAVMCGAFFFIFPIPSGSEKEEEAISSYYTIDRIIFIFFFVIILLAVTGIITPGPGWEISGKMAYVFWPILIIAGLAGMISPPDTRPYTGIIVLILALAIFTTTIGEQTVGISFFGEWYPQVHNALSNGLGPVGDFVATIQDTFGTAFTLLTNPTGFAHNIMTGSFEKNPYGKTGAFGVEIENLQTPPIYPGTMAVFSVNIKNVGPAIAKDVKVNLQFSEDFNKALNVENTIPTIEEMKPNEIIPLFFTINASDCDEINDDPVFSDINPRNKYIRVNVTIEYNYEVSSWMPLEVISDSEWKKRVSTGSFIPRKITSHISTSPAKLSIGSFDQPLIAGDNRPFYIGFNLSSAEGPKSRVIWDRSVVILDYPEDLEKDNIVSCSKKADLPGTLPYKWSLKEHKGKAIFCTFSKTPNPGDAPSKTYMIRANSSFGFLRWETRDTLFAFDDVCGDTDAGIPSTSTKNCEELGNYLQ